MRQMAGAADRYQARIGDAVVKGVAVRDRNALIALAPEDQRRQLRAIKVAQQSRIIGELPGEPCQRASAEDRGNNRFHAWGIGNRLQCEQRIRFSKQRPAQRRAIEAQNVGHRRRGQSQAESVDEHEAAQPLAIANRPFCRDPTAEGRAGERGPHELHCFAQIEIMNHQVLHRLELLETVLRAGETGMNRHEDFELGR